MMHGKGLAFAGVCLRAWRRLCTQQTGWPAEKAALEQALRVAQTSKDTEVRRVEKLQWEARLEAQVRAARAAPHRTAPHRPQGSAPPAPARTCTRLHEPVPDATCTQPVRAAHPAAPSAPCRALRTLVRPTAPPCAPPHPRAPRRTPVRPAAPPCRRASPSSSMLCASASSRGGTARGTPSCTPRSAGARTPRAARRTLQPSLRTPAAGARVAASRQPPLAAPSTPARRRALVAPLTPKPPAPPRASDPQAPCATPA